MPKDLYWEIQELHSTKQLIEFIKTLKENLSRYDWLLLTKSSHMTKKLIEEYSEDIDWQYYCTFNSDLSIDFLERNIGFINWYSTSAFQSLTLAFIKKYEDKLSFNKLITNDYIRRSNFFTEVYNMYKERLKKPAYVQVWEENKKNSIFKADIKPIRSSFVAKTEKVVEAKEEVKPVVQEKKIYTDADLLKMSKQEMKQVLSELDIRIYYHDTLEILRNKIKESQGEKKNDSTERSEDQVRTPGNNT